MKKIILTLTLLTWSAALLFATEARVESMGNNSDFIRDDVSVFENPATAFDFGNLLVGSLGRISRNEATGQWVRSDEWYGGWAVYPLKSGKKVLLGATLNRATDIIQQYQKLDNDDFFTVFGSQIDPGMVLPRDAFNNTDYLDAVQIRGPYGNVYAFGGLSLNEELSVALGGRYAGYAHDAGAASITRLSLAGANLGITYKIDRHALEASVNYGRFSLERTETAPYALNLSSLDNSFNVLLRGFIRVNDKNTFVPLLSLDKIALLGIDNTDLGFGGGFNRDLHKGFVWAGMRYAYHTAKYPERIGGKLIYPKYTGAVASGLTADMDETSHKLLFSFGVEKKMLWDWFHLRVGGNKVFEYLSKKKASLEYTSEERLDERDAFGREVDAVGWGIALGTPDDRLLFDITVSEEFPYSNILSGGEDGIMLSRISAALKF